MFELKWPDIYIFRVGNFLALLAIPYAAFLYFCRIAPKSGIRYRLTNRRVLDRTRLEGAGRTFNRTGRVRRDQDDCGAGPVLAPCGRPLLLPRWAGGLSPSGRVASRGLSAMLLESSLGPLPGGRSAASTTAPTHGLVLCYRSSVMRGIPERHKDTQCMGSASDVTIQDMLLRVSVSTPGNLARWGVPPRLVFLLSTALGAAEPPHPGLFHVGRDQRA